VATPDTRCRRTSEVIVETREALNMPYIRPLD